MTVVSDPEANVAKAPPPRIHLAFLDGIRGIAALYVVLAHLTGPFGTIRQKNMPAWLWDGTYWMRYGHLAVCVFIVLSGYCLMLPVAKSSDGELRGGFLAFIRRRAWRIIPPYYAALVISLAVNGLSYKLQMMKGIRSPNIAIDFNAPNLISHVLLLHNWNTVWSQAISTPFWSIAVEWQIYFLFALILLPMWRRCGNAAVVLVGLLIGLAPHYLLPTAQNMDWSSPWMLGLFAMGMAAAAVAFPSQKSEPNRRMAGNWGILTAVFGLADLALIVLSTTVSRSDLFILTDIVTGLASTCLILYCTKASVASQRDNVAQQPLLRFLESPVPLALGAFSYSLYLIHRPILWKMLWVTEVLHMSPAESFLAMLFPGLPITLALSYLFYLVFEKRFMHRQRVIGTKAVRVD